MKKTISLLLALSLLCCFATAHAAPSGVSMALSDAAADRPVITYQGIAWGEKRAEARKAVVNAGLVKKNVTWQFAAAGGENVGHFAMDPDSYLGWDFYEGYSAGGTSDWLYPNNISGKVAGYSI